MLKLAEKPKLGGEGGAFAEGVAGYGTLASQEDVSDVDLWKLSPEQRRTDAFAGAVTVGAAVETTAVVNVTAANGQSIL